MRSEIDGAFNLRFKDAEGFFACCSGLNTEIILSELFFEEVENITSLPRQKTMQTIKDLGLNLVVFGRAEKEKAKEISQKLQIHFSDAQHIANAVASDCKTIVTWNKKDFEKANSIIACATPQELLRQGA